MIDCVQFKMIGEKKWLVLENVIVQIAKITTKEFIVSAVKLHLTRWGCASVILERTKKMDKEKQIKSTDWLTKNYSKEELAEMKAKADKEAEEELKQKQIEEMARIIGDCAEMRPFNTCDECREVTGNYCCHIKLSTKMHNADYRKERVGKWVEQPDGTHFCSNCGKDATYNYDDREICGVACTYCGARMKGE